MTASWDSLVVQWFKIGLPMQGTQICSLVWEEGNGNPLQYSCLENPMDGGAW